MYVTRVPRRIPIEAIVDQQLGSTCGPEAMENLIQLARPANNALSREILLHARMAGEVDWINGESIVRVEAYPRILASYGVRTVRVPVARTEVWVRFLVNKQAILAIVDPRLIQPLLYAGTTMLHAVVISSYTVDRENRLVSLGILDSNQPDTQIHVPFDTFLRATTSYPLLVSRHQHRDDVCVEPCVQEGLDLYRWRIDTQRGHWYLEFVHRLIPVF